MDTRKLIIIVPGSKTKQTGFRFIDDLLDRFYAYFKVDTENDDRWTSELKEIFAQEVPAAEVCVFNWSGGFTPWSLRKAAKELCSILNSLDSPDTTLFCKSLGGRVGELAAKYWRRKITIIEVATPHGPFERHILNARIINIYSPQDSYLNLGNKVLYLGLGRNKLKHAKNISLDGISHSGFNRNTEVHHDGEKIKLFKFYRQLIYPGSRTSD